MKRKSYRANNALQVLGNITDTEFQDVNHAGTPRDALEGGCYQFRGTGDYLEGSNVVFETINPAAMSFWIKLDRLDHNAVVNRINDDVSIGFQTSTNSMYVEFGLSGTNEIRVHETTATPIGEWVHYVVAKGNSRNASDVAIYRNGELSPSAIDVDNLTVPLINIATSIGSQFQESTGQGTPVCQMYEYVIFGDAITPTLAREIYNRTYCNCNVRLFHKMSETSGAVSYDSSGLGRHSDIINAVTVNKDDNPNSIHQTQLEYSWENLSGYSLLNDVIIPRNESVLIPPFRDVLGNNLQFIGHAPYNAKLVNAACLQGGNSAFLSVPGLLSTDVVSAVGNNSATPTITAGQINFTDDERYYDIHISRNNVEIYNFSLSEPIINPASHTYYNKLGTNHATLMNGSAANYGLQNEFFDLMKNGFSGNGGIVDTASDSINASWRQLAVDEVVVDYTQPYYLEGIVTDLDTISGSTFSDITVQASTGGDAPTLKFLFGYGHGAYGSVNFLVEQSPGVEVIRFSLTTLGRSIQNGDRFRIEFTGGDRAQYSNYNVTFNNATVSTVITTGGFRAAVTQTSFFVKVASNYNYRGGFYMDLNGQYTFEERPFIPKHTTNNTDALGNPLTHPQDGNSFLNCQTQLQQRRIPEIVQSDNGNEWFNPDGSPISRSFSSISGNLSDKYFADISNKTNGVIKNIRTHKKPLVRRQLDIEKQITKN